MPFAVPSMAGNRGDGCRNEKGGTIADSTLGEGV